MAGRIPEQFIDDLLARTDIVDLIETYLPLRKAGRDFQALCPFHGEKTPSFTVSREKQFYHCFGCGAHGSAIGFLMQHRNLEFVEAVEELATAAGMEVPREARRERSSSGRELYAVLERARTWFEQQLRRGPGRERAVDYLKGRGITGEVAKTFRLGFAPDGWRNLHDALSGDGLDEGLMERAGLAIKRERGGYYDRFRDRVMFPIHDRRGRVIGFGGRVIDQGEPKYLNSPETDVFHKGRELYGLHEALQAGKPGQLIVVEGYMDVIALHQHGLANAVATLGTAVTGDHLDLLFRQVPEVVFCFDGDAAGRRAAWKALEVALPRMAGNRQVRFAFLPEGHDPDTAVREYGADGLFRAGRLYGLGEYLLEHLQADLDASTADGKTRLVAQAETYLRQIPDQAHRATAAHLLATVTKFDEELLRQRLGFTGRRTRERPAAPASLDRYTRRSLEEQALALLVQEPRLAACLDESGAAVLAEELPSASLLLEVWRTLRETATSTAALIERYRDNPQGGTLEALAVLDLNLPAAGMETEMRAALERLLKRAEAERVKRLRAIPLDQLTAEQKDLLRNHRRTRSP
ncbi:MAG: DNA primase [Gammaproteobacteria bacterium]|nr:DNA primase [Gammaproteobacteria bacterium]MCP5201685.1 DNA primase [Gammaproteobacteria bacterium]